MTEIEKLKEELRVLQNKYDSLKNAFYTDMDNHQNISDNRNYFNLLNNLTLELYEAKTRKISIRYSVQSLVN